MSKRSSKRNDKKKALRLFFGINLSADEKTKLLTIQNSIGALQTSLVAPENFHITLSFLGQTSEKQLDTILEYFEPLHTVPFSIELSDLIFWPKPAILVLSVQDKSSRLLQCKKQIEQQLSGLKIFSFDKKSYVPHITLFRQVETPPEQNQHFSGKININEISLFLSEPTHKGIQYQTIETWQLENNNVKQQLLGKR